MKFAAVWYGERQVRCTVHLAEREHLRYVALFKTMKPVSTAVEYFPTFHWTVLV
jgi:hypothetical protein